MTDDLREAGDPTAHDADSPGDTDLDAAPESLDDTPDEPDTDTDAVPVREDGRTLSETLAAERSGELDTEPAPGTRIAERIVRRPRNWWNRPWTTDRIIRFGVTSFALTVTTVIMMRVANFMPIPGLGHLDLILDETTPTGGDMGAHVWAPAFLRDHFLPSGQLSGWTMDWYGGLPLYRFYMVVPALAIVALDVVLPYGVAFKLVAISGLVTFPAACWAFGRLAAFRHPLPELFAFAGTCFLLDESFEIYGGNVKSTMAGEYSFSISLTLAVLGLGLLAHGLRTGRFRVWAAVVLSLAAVSHGIVLIFVAVSAIVICLVWIDSKRFVFALTTGITTLLLSAWWVGPFLFGHEFMTDMKYGFRPSGASDSFWDMFFPLTPALDILVTSLAIVGFAAFVLRRQLTGVAIGVICLLFVLGVYITRDSLPIIGLLWNPRLLPFVYLTRYLLMVVGAYELLSLGINALRDRRAAQRLDAKDSAGAFAAVSVSILLVFGWMYEVLPFDGRATVTVAGEDGGPRSVYAWGPLRKGPESGRAVADGWSRYNFRGYEGRPAYPAYNHLVNTMDDLGDERGCGRALWENNSANGEYGTTMALMLLPHWTNSCISSMEGLFFEATASTNYHFLTAAAVSESSSNPVRQLRYTNNDAEIGVQHMRDLGVRYLMVRTDAAKTEAAAAEGLEQVGTSGTWNIYEVADSEIVAPLEFEPVVVDHADDDRYKPGDDRERNLELGTSWFQNRDVWPAIPVDEGPEEWQRVTASIVEDQRIEPFDDQSRKVDFVSPEGGLEPTALPAVQVSDIEMTENSIDFSVDQIGVPVVVKVSYFPNWNVSGAEGPYRAGANHMIVVPTQNEVSLTYDSHVALDWFFYALTAVGIALCFVWRRRGDMSFGGERPAALWAPGAGFEPSDRGDGSEGATDDRVSAWSAPPSVSSADDVEPEGEAASEGPDTDAALLDPTPVQSSLPTDALADLDDDLSGRALGEMDPQTDASPDEGTEAPDLAAGLSPPDSGDNDRPVG